MGAVGLRRPTFIIPDKSNFEVIIVLYSGPTDGVEGPPDFRTSPHPHVIDATSGGGTRDNLDLWGIEVWACGTNGGPNRQD